MGCIKLDFFEIDGLKYIIKYPRGFPASEKYPALLFLHGAGTRGSDINKLIDNVFFNAYDEHKDLPFVVVAPLCSENTWFDMWERLKALAVHTSSLQFVDSDRIYMMGTSMGGYATWQLAMSLPHIFSAIVPICGGGMYWNSSRLKNIPVWAFHGALDETVLCSESKKMVDSVNNNGGNARLTVYPMAHHDAWSSTYANREVFEWLLSCRKNSRELSDNPKYNDSKIYG